MARRDTPVLGACPFGACDGTGWILGPEDVARPCKCRERTIARARTRGVASVIPAKYRGVSFERPPVTLMSRDWVDPVREYTADFEPTLDQGQGLWFLGDVGTGKTTLAMLVSSRALEAGRSVAIYSLPKLLAHIRRTFDDNRGEQTYLELFDQLTSVDLLHIDDLGAEKRSDWVIEQLYALINERYESGKAIVVTSNIDPDDKDPHLALKKLRDEISARTVSRLEEICGEPICMFGEDQRSTAADRNAVDRLRAMPGVADGRGGAIGGTLGSLD